MKRKIILLILGFAIIQTSCNGPKKAKKSNEKTQSELSETVDRTIEIALKSLRNSVTEINDRELYPDYATKDLKWKLRDSESWTSGFYPGCLWLGYELSKDEDFKQWAIEWTAGIEKEKFNTNTHDLGFRFGCTFGNGLKLAPNDPLTKNYKEIALTAAETMEKRYYPSIKSYTSNWDRKPLPNSVPVVIDIMMNLEFLMWSANNGGDPNSLKHSIDHALTTYKDFIREDGGSYHIVRYDKDTGAILNKGQLQGDVDESTWSRGQAWMVYGLVTMYRFTEDSQYLDMAMETADYFINHLPEDRVANWDFQSKLDFRDASASAVVASALFELQGYMKDENKKTYYMTEAEKMLEALCLPPYFSEGKGTNCLLLHSTQYYHLTENTDVPCSFADYYFLEALIRYKNLNKK